MASKIVTIEGMDELIADLRALGANVARVLEDATRAGAMVIESAADAAAPGPYIEIETQKKTSSFCEVAIGPDKDHWFYRFFESGVQPHEISASTAGALVFEGSSGLVVTAQVSHTGMAARPFLRPAVDENESRVVDAAGDVLSRAIDAVASGP